MPFLDITDILQDPDFAQPFGSVQLITYAQTVGNDGIAKYIAQPPVNFDCVLQPASIDQSQLADLSRVAERIMVWSKLRLNTLTDFSPADIVLWRNRPYMVMIVEDWTTFGAGFTRATCELRLLESVKLL